MSRIHCGHVNKMWLKLITSEIWPMQRTYLIVQRASQELASQRMVLQFFRWVNPNSTCYVRSKGCTTRRKNPRKFLSDDGTKKSSILWYLDSRIDCARSNNRESSLLFSRLQHWWFEAAASAFFKSSVGFSLTQLIMKREDNNGWNFIEMVDCRFWPQMQE